MFVQYVELDFLGDVVMNNWVVLGLQTIALIMCLICILVGLPLNAGTLGFLVFAAPGWRD